MGTVGGGNRPSIRELNQQVNFQNTRVTSGRITITPDNWQQTLRAVGGDDAVLSLTPEQRQELFENGRLEVQYDASFQQAGEGALTLMTKGLAAIFAPSKSLSALSIDAKAVEMLQDPSAEIGFAHTRQTRGRLTVFPSRETRPDTDDRRPPEVPPYNPPEDVGTNPYRYADPEPNLGEPTPLEEYQEQIGTFGVSHSMGEEWSWTEYYNNSTPEAQAQMDSDSRRISGKSFLETDNSTRINAMPDSDRLQWYTAHQDYTQSGNISQMQFGEDVSAALSSAGWRDSGWRGSGNASETPEAEVMAEAAYGPDMADLNSLAAGLTDPADPNRTFADLTNQQAIDLYNNASPEIQAQLDTLAENRYGSMGEEDVSFTDVVNNDQFGDFATRTVNTQVQLDTIAERAIVDIFGDPSMDQLNEMAAAVEPPDANRTFADLTEDQALQLYADASPEVKAQLDHMAYTAHNSITGLDHATKSPFQRMFDKRSGASDFNRIASRVELADQIQSGEGDIGWTDLSHKELNHTGRQMQHRVLFQTMGVIRNGDEHVDNAHTNLRAMNGQSNGDLATRYSQWHDSQEGAYSLAGNAEAEVPLPEHMKSVFSDRFSEAYALENNGEAPTQEQIDEAFSDARLSDLELLTMKSTPLPEGFTPNPSDLSLPENPTIFDYYSARFDQAVGTPSRPAEGENMADYERSVANFRFVVETNHAQVGQSETFSTNDNTVITAVTANVFGNGDTFTEDDPLAGFEITREDTDDITSEQLDAMETDGLDGRIDGVLYNRHTSEEVGVQDAVSRDDMRATGNELDAEGQFFVDGGSGPTSGDNMADVSQSYENILNNLDTNIGHLPQTAPIDGDGRPVLPYNSRVDTPDDVANYRALETQIGTVPDPSADPPVEGSGILGELSSLPADAELTINGNTMSRDEAIQLFTDKKAELHQKVDFAEQFVDLQAVGTPDGFPAPTTALQGNVNSFTQDLATLQGGEVDTPNEVAAFERQEAHVNTLAEGVAAMPEDATISLPRLDQNGQLVREDGVIQFDELNKADAVERMDALKARFNTEMSSARESSRAEYLTPDTEFFQGVHETIEQVVTNVQGARSEGDLEIVKQNSSRALQATSHNLLSYINDQLPPNSPRRIDPDALAALADNEVGTQVALTRLMQEFDVVVDRTAANVESGEGHADAETLAKAQEMQRVLHDALHAVQDTHAILGTGQERLTSEDMETAIININRDLDMLTNELATDEAHNGVEGSGRTQESDTVYNPSTRQFLKDDLLENFENTISQGDFVNEMTRRYDPKPDGTRLSETELDTLHTQLATFYDSMVAGDTNLRVRVFTGGEDGPRAGYQADTNTAFIRGFNSGDENNQYGGRVMSGDAGMQFAGLEEIMEHAIAEFPGRTDFEVNNVLNANAPEGEQVDAAQMMVTRTLVNRGMTNEVAAQIGTKIQDGDIAGANTLLEQAGLVDPAQREHVIGQLQANNSTDGPTVKANILSALLTDTEDAATRGGSIDVGGHVEEGLVFNNPDEGDDPTVDGAQSNDPATGVEDSGETEELSGDQRAYIENHLNSFHTSYSEAIRNSGSSQYEQRFMESHGVRVTPQQALNLINLHQNRGDVDGVIAEMVQGRTPPLSQAQRNNLRDTILAQNPPNSGNYVEEDRANQAQEDTGSAVRNFFEKAFELMEQFDQVIQKLVAKIKQQWYEHMAATIQRNNPNDPLSSIMLDSIEFARDQSEFTQLLHTSMKHVTDKVWNDDQFLHRWENFGGEHGSAAAEGFDLAGREANAFGDSMNARNIGEVGDWSADQADGEMDRYNNYTHDGT